MMNKREEIPALPDLGGNLRRERRKKELSLSDLALISGISKAMLSQIETNKVNPTIATLWKISHALSVDLNFLISGSQDETRIFEVTRAEDLPSLSPGNGSAVFTVISSSDLAEDCEAYKVRLPAGSCHSSLPHTGGTQELLLVTSGTVVVAAGERHCRLRTGDVLRYEADVVHSLKNDGPGEAELFMVVRFRKS